MGKGTILNTVSRKAYPCEEIIGRDLRLVEKVNHSEIWGKSILA